jgi:hypothetical protein
MNVNCQASQQLFNNNNDKFGNLRLGPQLMKDIKKMLTHPMRNPYDRNSMRGNQIVMQDYRLPFGQMFPSGALTAGPNRTPNNIYIPAKQIQPPIQDNYDTNDIAFAASTPSSRYVPAAFTTFQQTTQGTETFQRQRQNGQYVQRQQNTNLNNGHAGQFTQAQPTANLQFSRVTQSSNNAQYGQRLGNLRSRPTQATSTQNTINFQSGQLNQQQAPYNYQNPSRLSNGKQAEFSVAYTKQQYNSNQEKQPYTYSQPQIQFPNGGTSGNEVKQNLVSPKDIPSTVVTKTLTLKRIIQDPKQGSPKSRITVKTWIVKPSKAAKLVDGSYTYDKPTQPTAQKIINAPYNYDKPTQPPAQKLIATTSYAYVYNQPTTAQKLISEPDKPYIYNKPTTAAKLIAAPSPKPTRTTTTVTTPRPTLSRSYLSPTSIPPTLSSRLYLPPTTYNPSSRLYLPPSQAPVVLSRQYLAPTAIQQTTNRQSGQLKAAPTTPSPVYAMHEREDLDNPTFTHPNQVKIINIDRNNLTFTDILTKEKLDNTVSNIVEDTSKILVTAPPAQFGQLQDFNSADYPEESYLPPQSSTDSGENLTALPPTTESKSARLISSPSTDLEPPSNSFNNNQNTNQLSNLPFYKDSVAPTNTIERTVSLKISIPEKIATYLFKGHNDSDFDKLEILNTGSSNYLVLTNNNVNKNSGNFIPIGKLISDKQSNISDSQALVFSLLADSINVAKEYNLAQQGVTHSTPLETQIQNIDSEDIAQISNKVSELTSSQFSGSNQANYKSANLVATTQSITTNNNQGYQYNEPRANHLTQNQYSSQQYNIPSHQDATLSRYENDPNSEVETNSQQVYSGQLYQLPVPDVTSQIYNRQSTSNNAQSNNIQHKQSEENVPSGNNNNDIKTLEGELEKVHSHSTNTPLPSPARLEVAPTSELDHFNSHENFNKFISSNSGRISAQLRDKIVGTIPHPLEDNKVVTYKKDESYYVYTKLDNNIEQNIQNERKTVSANIGNSQQSGKLIQENELPNIVAFQLIPSVSYQLEDEKEQQKLLNAFQIDEYGQPKQKANLIDESNKPVLTTNVNYSIDHTLSSKQTERQSNEVKNLYSGPSSYLAPQASVGRLDPRPELKARLELEDNSKGYLKVAPLRQFTFK